MDEINRKDTKIEPRGRAAAAPAQRAMAALSVAVLIAAGLLLPLLASSSARAEAASVADAAEPQAPRDETMLWAARACYLEATWRESDCIALLWVTRKRAKRAQQPWLEMLRSYSAVEANTPRAKEIRQFPWGDIPDKSAMFNERWQRLRDLVVEFTEGKHPNPCPHAEHWGGSMDHAHGRMVPARCAAATANTFYAVRRR